jgi:hypothetical protein
MNSTRLLEESVEPFRRAGRACSAFNVIQLHELTPREKDKS